MRPTLRVPAALVVSLLPPLVSSTPAESICDIHGAPRIVAVGDVHGAYENFVKALRMTGLVDEEARWAGGKTHLVQTGDLLDHGKDTRQVLDLLIQLEKEAKKAGGRVHALLGNHEVMNVLGDLRFVDPREYEAFRTSRSRELRERFLKLTVRRARAEAEARDEAFDEKAYRTTLEEEAPLGFVERTEAFSAEGRYGRWIRERKVVARVNGVVFLHGGLSPEVAALGCETINETVHRELTRDFDKTSEDPIASLTASPTGPLWYRGLAREDEATFIPALVQILRHMDARAIVVGHTVTRTGRIQHRFGGRVVMIDAGMAPWYQDSLAALEIGPDGRMTAIYPDAREPIERQAADGPLPIPALDPQPREPASRAASAN
jgi:hypothetical protein